MKPAKRIFAIALLISPFLGCEQDQLLLDNPSDMDATLVAMNGVNGIKIQKPGKITGTLEVVWKGATKGSDMGNKPENLLAFVEVTALEGTQTMDPRGEIIYTVLDTDFSLHREIKAQVLDVYINPTDHKGWIVARVVSDSKGCDGNGGSGHDPDCSSGGHDDGCGGSDGDSSHDGGCSHDDTGEGGCTHDDTTGEGGCTHDDTTGEGGCTHDDTTSEGGCSHDTGEGGCSGGGSEDPNGGGGSPGGEGSPGGGDNGNPLSGKNCRIGQILAMKMHDGSTPGTLNDGITWKWFGPDTEFASPLDDPASWPHLCKKEILEGNLVIHL